jgi:hypothetical protein
MAFLQNKSFWFFLLVGVGLRIWNLDSPLIDAMYFRQTQTADAIRSMIEEPGFQLDANTSWRGTTGARLLLEFPLYNQLVQGVYEGLVLIVPTDPAFAGRADPRWIDVSGRLVSITFWALAFWLVQFLWQRFLNPRQAFWANMLVVFAPLSVFYGQAVMPEMLFVAITIGFVIALLRYSEHPSAVRFGTLALLALLGCLIKFPAFSHLGLIAVILLWVERGWKFLLLRPVHWLGLIAILVLVKLWSGQITAVNSAHFTSWTSSEVLKGFFGDPAVRLSPHLYIKVAGYLTAFVLTPLGVFLAAIGLFQLWKRRTEKIALFLGAWLLSLVVYVLVWGPHCAGGHAYYNLPMLFPAAMLFGLGMDCVLRSSFFSPRSLLKNQPQLSAPQSSPPASLPSTLAGNFSAFQRFNFSALLFLLLLPAFLMTAYFFREDRVVYAVAKWAKENVPLVKPVAVKLNHSPHAIDYMHVPTVGYYAGRKAFMLTKETPPEEYSKGLAECDFIIESLPVPLDGASRFAVALKGAHLDPDPLTSASKAGFVPGPEQSGGFRVWSRAQAKPD